jgi:hypothetical protein
MSVSYSAKLSMTRAVWFQSLYLHIAVLCSMLLLACSKQLDTFEGFGWGKAKSKPGQQNVFCVVIAKSSLIIQMRLLPLFTSRIVQSGCYELARCSMSVLSMIQEGLTEP